MARPLGGVVVSVAFAGVGRGEGAEWGEGEAGKVGGVPTGGLWGRAVN